MQVAIVELSRAQVAVSKGEVQDGAEQALEVVKALPAPELSNPYIRGGAGDVLALVPRTLVPAEELRHRLALPRGA
ncbi:hypothetical protein [Sinosporangium album]|uniref:hypothetical protein n=1 Tax=Sinosporangium album TaxID=504805 RepID=UPI00115FDF69|nr:hypothetical protein [Sinosporangium album]